MNAAELARAQTGSVLGGRYLLLRVIGTGGMGAVFEAEHTVTKRRVALKLIHRELLEKANVAQRFLREAQAPAALRHSSIVEVLDAGQDPDGRFFLVFDLLEGITLHAALKLQRIHPVDVVPVCMTVLAGLAEAHAKGLVHRDIKPGNIYLVNGSIEQVKLLDFGIAKEIGDDARERRLTAPGAIVGTARYMSPEQAASGPVDGRADLWGVGATLYRAFAGKAPFSNQSLAQHINSLLTQRVPSVKNECPTISAELGYVIDRALERDPSDRWQSAEEMREALAGVDLEAERRLALIVVEDFGEAKPWDRTTTRQAIPLDSTEPSSTPAASTAAVSPRLPIGKTIAWAVALATILFLIMQKVETPPPTAEPQSERPRAIAAPPALPAIEPAPAIDPPREQAPPPAKRERRRSKKRAPAEITKPEPKKQESPWNRPKREFKPDR